jgi:hypothetical protein
MRAQGLARVRIHVESRIIAAGSGPWGDLLDGLGGEVGVGTGGRGPKLNESRPRDGSRSGCQPLAAFLAALNSSAVIVRTLRLSIKTLPPLSGTFF